MSDLGEMLRRNARPGRVEWIGLRPERRAPIVSVDQAELHEDGLAGDRARKGKRALTLVQSEHLPVMATLMGRDDIDPADLRRNIVVSGINLFALRHRRIRIGAAEIELTIICAPCSRMEETFGHGGYSAVRGHGGWCATVLSPGLIRVGDAVTLAD